MKKRRQPREWYGIGAIAAILNVEEWQIKALRMKPYEIEPEKGGEGRGSRNLYSFWKLLQIDLATTLSRKSQMFSSDQIPAAVRQITKGLVSHWAESYSAGGNAPPIVLTFDGRKWKILGQEEADKAYREALKGGEIWVSLNLVPDWESIVQKISELEAEGGI